MEKIESGLILVAGPPNGGKGTLVKAIHTKLEVAMIGCGDVCRKEEEGNTPIGIRMKEYKQRTKHTLAPTEMLIDPLRAELRKVREAASNILLDGFVRLGDQVPLAISLMSELGLDNITLVWVDTPIEECRQRAIDRGRKDDEDIDRRLEDYVRDTVPALQALSGLSSQFPIKVIPVNGMQMMDWADNYALALHYLNHIPFRTTPIP
ncbi:MAG: hypothetical protein RL094_573 [Candidatus Parcubacteria bacterium]